MLTYDEALDDPHIQERGMIVDVEHPIIGPMHTIAPPTQLLRTSSSACGRQLRGSVSTPHPSCRSWALIATSSTDLFTDGTLYDAHPELQGEHR